MRQENLSMCMTKSKMPFSNEDINKILHLFLEGELPLDELCNLLQEHITIEFPSVKGSRKILKNDLEGTVSLELKPCHLSKMIRRYLEGSVSDKVLSDWSAFIFLSTLFIPEGETDQERWEAGDGPVWDILQQLISPSVFGGLDFRKAEEYLNQLEI
jgi:hypothetical protein